jgi:deoxycytidine triphosphate deaminase
MDCLLSDSEIESYVQNGELIKENYDAGFLQPASYDLRMGDVVTSLTRGKSIDIVNGKFDIHPGELVSIHSMEKVAFPLNIQGRICAKVSLLEKGFSSIATKIDPGYGYPDGWNLALVFKHLGHEPIELKPGDPICSLEFEKLERNATHGYRGKNPKTFIHPAETVDPIGKSQLDFRKLEKEELERFHGHPIDDIILSIGKLQGEVATIKGKLPRRRAVWITGFYVYALYFFFGLLFLFYWKELAPEIIDNTTFIAVLGIGAAVVGAVLALYGIKGREK